MPRFATSDGLSLAWEEEGAGQPVLCLPGLTRNARDFDDLAAALDARLRARPPDPPDLPRPRRLRPRPGAGSTTTSRVEARDVVELLDHLGLPKATIVGTSRGGLVAMVLAATVKDRLAGVLLNDVGPELAPEGLAAIMTYLGVAPRAKDFPSVVAALKARIGTAFPDLDDARWATPRPPLVRRRRRRAGRSTTTPASATPSRRSAAQPAVDLWPLFDALDGLPLALVRGANSDLLTAETVGEDARAPAGHDLRRGPGPRPRPLPRRARGASPPSTPLLARGGPHDRHRRDPRRRGAGPRHPPHAAALLARPRPRGRPPRAGQGRMPAGHRLLQGPRRLGGDLGPRARGARPRRPRLLVRQPRAGRRLGRRRPRHPGGDPDARPTRRR